VEAIFALREVSLSLVANKGPDCLALDWLVERGTPDAEE